MEKSNNTVKWLLGGSVVVFVLFLLWWFFGREEKKTEAQLTSDKMKLPNPLEVPLPPTQGVNVSTGTQEAKAVSKNSPEAISASFASKTQIVNNAQWLNNVLKLIGALDDNSAVIVAYADEGYLTDSFRDANASRVPFMQNVLTQKRFADLLTDEYMKQKISGRFTGSPQSYRDTIIIPKLQQYVNRIDSQLEIDAYNALKLQGWKFTDI